MSWSTRTNRKRCRHCKATIDVQQLTKTVCPECGEDNPHWWHGGREAKPEADRRDKRVVIKCTTAEKATIAEYGTDWARRTLLKAIEAET